MKIVLMFVLFRIQNFVQISSLVGVLDINICMFSVLRKTLYEQCMTFINTCQLPCVQTKNNQERTLEQTSAWTLSTHKARYLASYVIFFRTLLPFISAAHSARAPVDR